MVEESLTIPEAATIHLLHSKRHLRIRLANLIGNADLGVWEISLVASYLFTKLQIGIGCMDSARRYLRAGFRLIRLALRSFCSKNAYSYLPGYLPDVAKALRRLEIANSSTWPPLTQNHNFKKVLLHIYKRWRACNGSQRKWRGNSPAPPSSPPPLTPPARSLSTRSTLQNSRLLLRFVARRKIVAKALLSTVDLMWWSVGGSKSSVFASTWWVTDGFALHTEQDGSCNSTHLRFKVFDANRSKWISDSFGFSRFYVVSVLRRVHVP